MLMKLITQDVFQTDSQGSDQNSNQIDLQTQFESQESDHNINEQEELQTESKSHESEHNINTSEFESNENVLSKIENPENLFEQGNKLMGILFLNEAAIAHTVNCTGNSCYAQVLLSFLLHLYYNFFKNVSQNINRSES